MVKNVFLRGAAALTVAGIAVKILGGVNRILLSRILGRRRDRLISNCLSRVYARVEYCRSRRAHCFVRHGGGEGGTG